MLTARRKELHEAMHPETKVGKARGRAGGGKVAAKDAKLASFVGETAKRSGKAKRSIARDAQRGKALGKDTERIVGTSLDKGNEIDALVKLDPEDRKAIVGLAAGGANVSAAQATLLSAKRANELRHMSQLRPSALARTVMPARCRWQAHKNLRSHAGREGVRIPSKSGDALFR